MNTPASKLREGIVAAAKYAALNEPDNVDQRARSFVAGLSGWVGPHDPELQALIWALLNSSSPAPLTAAPQ